MQFSRTTPVVPSPVVNPAVDPRIFHGLSHSMRLPSVYFSDPVDPPTPPVEKETVAEQVKKALAEILGAKGNDPMAALETMIRKSHKLEQRAEDAEKALKDLKATVPAETDVAELAKWRELGESPGKVKATIDAGATATQEAAKFKRDSALTAAGIDPEKFNALSGADTWTFSEKEEKGADGKPVKVQIATIAGADGQPVTKPVGELVAEQFPQFAEALKMAPGAVAKPVAVYGKGAPLGGGQAVNEFDRIREESRAARESVQPAKTWTEQLGISP